MTENNTDEISGSIFDDDVDLDEIPDSANHLPADTYFCRVTKAILKKSERTGKIGLIISYQVSEGPYSTMFPITEWLWAPRGKDIRSDDEKVRVDAIRANAKIKERYVAFGIPADEMKSAEPKDLIGAFVRVKTYNKDEKDQDGNQQERIKVQKVMPAENVPGSDEGLDVFANNTPPI